MVHFYKIKESNYIQHNSGSVECTNDSAAKISQHTASASNMSNRPEQRRLRTENFAYPIFAMEVRNNELSPAALDALIKYGNNKEKLSPLNYAIAFAQDWTAIEALIDAGIGINSQEGQAGYTPLDRLLSLAIHGHPPYRENGTRLARKLIEKGIDTSLIMPNEPIFL